MLYKLSKGSLKNAINDIEEEYFEKTKIIEDEENSNVIIEEKQEANNFMKEIDDLKYFNEYGAFSSNGKEYLIKMNKENRLPTVWSHILANKKFGTLVTENMGGYTW